MNPMDGVGLAILALAVLRGMIRGLARELRGLGGILLAVVAAFKLRIPLGRGLARMMGSTIPLWVWEAAAFLVLLLVGVALVAALASRLWGKPTTTGTMVVDVAGGGLLGLVEGWLLFAAIVALLLTWPGAEVAGLLGGSDLAGLTFRFLPGLYRFLSGSPVL